MIATIIRRAPDHESTDSHFSDIAKLTVYVVDDSPEQMAQLGEPDLLIEVEAMAVLA